MRTTLAVALVWFGLTVPGRLTDVTPSTFLRSIEYSLGSVFSFIASHADEDTVLVVLGDHQPATAVAGSDSGEDVPITIIAKDPAVIDRVSGWGWKDGVRPDPEAPVGRMDAFRDKFLTAFNS